ncbi:MAG TPA: alpha/beta fold hydrolase [Streptosporangiaceae bacterium]|jgi:pimeloyl-ACP methyl ester carboxylesterase
MPVARSVDGTPITFDRAGAGPALILVSGALRDRSAARGLAAALAPDFTVYNYDRRGRGDSGDTAPYAVGKEIGDLAAMLAEAGGSALVYGHSSGGALALEAAARGLPITALAVYEPPYVLTAGQSARRVELAAAVGELIDAGRHDDAVERFLQVALGMSAAVTRLLRESRMWAPMQRLAATLRYDFAVLDGAAIPAGRLARITIPVLFLDGTASPAWAREPVRAAAAAIPGAQHRSLDRQDHSVTGAVLAPLLARFFSAGTTA